MSKNTLPVRRHLAKAMAPLVVVLQLLQLFQVSLSELFFLSHLKISQNILNEVLNLHKTLRPPWLRRLRCFGVAAKETLR